MTETTPQDAKQDQQEDNSPYSPLSSFNHSGLTSILLFDLNTSDAPTPRDITSYTFDVAFAADADGARDA